MARNLPIVLLGSGWCYRRITIMLLLLAQRHVLPGKMGAFDLWYDFQYRILQHQQIQRHTTSDLSIDVLLVRWCVGQVLTHVGHQRYANHLLLGKR
jgi:hypothetical protein